MPRDTRSPHQRECFRTYGAIVANEIINNISLPFLMGWLFVAARIYIYICVYVVRDARNFLAFGYSSIALPASSYLACVIARAFVLRNLRQSVRGRKTIAVGKSRTSQSCSVLFFPPSESRPKCISLGFLLVRFHLETGRVSRESDRIIPILSPRNLYHRIFACLLFLFTTDNGQ